MTSSRQTNRSSGSEPLKPTHAACDRVWGHDGASTVRVVDGVFLCPSCNQPTSAHTQATDIQKLREARANTKASQKASPDQLLKGEQQ